MSDHRRIDFIVMGAQKAGTTALFDHLSDDPALGLSKVKEVHFFDNDALDWATPDYGPYHDQFDWTGEQIRGGSHADLCLLAGVSGTYRRLSVRH